MRYGDTTMYDESDLLPLSALQHFLFCKRQCALIHVEQLWQENAFTAEGRLLHDKKVHNAKPEYRGKSRIEFGMPLRSLSLGLSGKADVVEFREGGEPYPIEYKRGRPKAKRVDEVQLCGQALCLEEMLGITVTEGALFYGKTRRRKLVPFDEELRELTLKTAGNLHDLIDSGITPPPVPTKQCKRCSFVELCMPELLSADKDVGRYIKRMLDKPIGSD